MRTRTMLCTLLVLSACGGDDGDRDDVGDTSAGDTGPADDSATTTLTTTTGATSTTTGATSVTTTTTSSPETTDDDSGEEDESSAGGGPGFQFDDSPPEDYARVDRMGMPAVATALISMKDAYNAANPSDDVEGLFVAEIVEHLDGLHTALDDDLVAAGLTPCAIDVCVDQGGPLVLPDTIKIDLGAASGFPNGRRPEDPVVDLTLAVILLDLGLHDVTTFADLPLNPPEGDVELSDEFPFFAAPHG